MANVPRWTNSELSRLARKNFNIHAGNVQLSGSNALDFMPFGLANVGGGVGSAGGALPGSGAGAGAGSSSVPGAVPAANDDDLDFDFGEVRQGVSRGGILNELRPNRRRRGGAADIDDFADIFGGDISEIDRLGVEEHKGGEDDFDLAAFADEVAGDLPDFDGDDFEDAFGRSINYMNISRFGGEAIGMRRLALCAAQLRRMRGELLTHTASYSGYYLHAVLSKGGDNKKFGEGAAVNFGTTSPDGESQRVPHNQNVWPFDIHNPLIGIALQNEQIVVSNQYAFNVGEDVDRLIEALIESMYEKMPQGTDSGNAQVDVQWRFMNLFLVKVVRANAGGVGQYDVDGTGGSEVAFSKKAVFNPKRSPSNNCFWECLFFFMFSKYEVNPNVERQWFTPFLHECLESTRRSKTARRTRIGAYAKRHAQALRERYDEYTERQHDFTKGVELREIDPILYYYGSQEMCLIMDKDGNALLGDIENAEKRRLENDQFTGIWFDDHMHLVISYTGSLIVKMCRRCNARFASERGLVKHLESNRCMTCACRAKNEPFEDELSWRFHIETRDTSCPKYRLESRESSMSELDDKGVRLRFLNDKRENYYDRKKKAQDALEKNHENMRNYREAIYFDLESVVPMNPAGLANAEHAYQQPYACGWILRSEALRGGDVNISYGDECMKEFVDYLDTLYIDIKKNEEQVWLDRATAGVLDAPIPKKSKGFCNYSHRVRAHWNLYIKSAQTPDCLVCGELLSEEHGYTHSDGHHTFSNCALVGYSRNTAEKNLDKNFNDNAPRIGVWAHNGGKYDWVFLHRYLMEVGRLDDLHIVRSSSKYFQISFKGVFVFKDSMNFVMGSLETLGKNFGVETLKGLFPYRLLTDMSRIDSVLEGEDIIREMIPHEYLQISEKLPGPMGVSIKRDMNESEYVDFFGERGWVYDVRSETIKYLKDDVMCLSGIVEKFRQGWLDMPFAPELFRFCTIGQMCHTYFLKNYLEPLMYPCLDVCEDAYIRKALYGGRTEVFRRLAPEGSKIHYVDVNSLYPYVMESRDLPCGDPIWTFRCDDPQLFQFSNSLYPVRTKVGDEACFDTIMHQLNSGENDEELYGFFEVDVMCCLESHYPILPERRSSDGGKTFKNMFTNMEKKKSVYYSEELKKAISLGCRVTKVWSFSQWQRGSVYKSLITVLKKQKLLGEGKDIDGNRIDGVEKNPSLRAAAKTAQNSLFGKTIQFIDESVRLVHTREGLFKSLDNPLSKVTIKPVFRSDVSDVVEVTTKYEIPNVQKRSCAAIGTAILAEARLVLYEFFEHVQNVGGEILYCDTDSIVFAGDVPLGDEHMDDCAYGKMKVEIDPDTICPGGFVGMSPKCYAFKLVDGAPYVRCKGVNLSQNLDTGALESDGIAGLLMEMEAEEWINNLALPLNDDDVSTRGISFDKMKDLITGKVDVLVTNQMQFLKTTNRMVSAYDNVKVLRSRFDKRKLGVNGMTFPWNDFNKNMDRILEDEDARSLSDYLDFVLPEELTVCRDEYKDNVFFTAIYDSWKSSDSQSAFYYETYLDEHS